MNTLVIDGKDTVLGRLASFAAKSALKGNEVIIVNCNDIIITGNKKDLEKSFKEKASRYGHSQKVPRLHKVSEKIVKKTIRGMLPNYREGRGRQAFKKIKCYNLVPKEFSEVKKISLKQEKTSRYFKISEFTKK